MKRRTLDRIAAIEKDRFAADRLYRQRFLEVQAAFNLPLPDGAPPAVFREGERLLIEAVSAYKANGDEELFAEFHAWVASVHARFGV
jgi:hypothetical protein